MPAAKDLPLAEALDLEIAPRLHHAYSDLRVEIVAAVGKGAGRGSSPFAEHAGHVLTWCRQQLERIESLRRANELFQARYANALDDSERRSSILDFAGQIGADKARLRRDEKAFRLFFDADAVQERCRNRIGERERALAYGLERLGVLAGAALAAGEIAGDAPLLGRGIGELLEQVRAYRGDSRVRQAAHKCLKRIIAGSPQRLQGFWIDTAVRDVRRVALDAGDDAWAQCDALDVLLALSPDSLVTVLDRRLEATSDSGSPLRQDNRLFVRRHIARMLAAAVNGQPRFAPYLNRLANDRDGAVRQALADALPSLPVGLFHPLFTRLRADRDPQVRAALFAAPERMATLGGAEAYLRHLLRVLGRDSDEFVLRIAMDAAARLGGWLQGREDPLLGEAVASLIQAMEALRQRSDNLKVRRWAGEAREQLWLAGDAEAVALAGLIEDSIHGLHEGRARRIADLRVWLDHDADKVGRVLSVLAQGDFGFDLRRARRPVLQRGDRFGRRLWRVWHELRESATDKRQAFLHTIGRLYAGSISAPSARMGELAPTKVPGEPLFQGKEAGWRNYLPLLDQVLSAIDRGGETRLFTSEGVTTLAAPSGLGARLRAFWRISRNFATLAALRNRESTDYVAALRAEGLGVRFVPHGPLAEDGSSGDPAVVHFFAFGGIVLALPVVWDRALAYFATVYANSLTELAMFLVLAWGWFFGRHIVIGLRMRNLRNGLSLVLGGWGTRGKSGTERLKAGLINALGLPLVSKTTGCEAMFLLGRSYGELIEMFLFRPYDKATIWEQFNLVRTARGLRARVFLWECMGLNPSYVRVLQQDWMRDDIATITNTYPDHEDVQGPAGRNIPEVMTQFIPLGSTLLTTEEEMLPILREAAADAGTRLRAVGWREAGLVHQRLLDRFPYAEHPFNIALVTAMADELGIAADYAVKEMSDRVVADLGVLKIYPHARVYDRTLEFVMGMSANERFGAMGNWTRMGFADHAMDRDPQIFVTTVVNNRADRVPRSRVFARMLVEDVSADKHFLIGSNIDGLLGFIEECWSEHAASLTLFDESGDPLAVLDALARRQRVPLAQDEIDARLAAMLAGLGADDASQTSHAAEIAAHCEDLRADMARYQQLRDAVAAGGDRAQLDDQVRQFLHQCFIRKLVPVRDYYMPGEDIIRLIARGTPPGLINRIMGMQNIKGTGLDFVYRWQAWEAVSRACAQAGDADPGLALRGVQTLSAFQEYGILSEGCVRETVEGLRQSLGPDAPFSLAQLDAIVVRLDGQMAALGGDESGDSGQSVEGGASMWQKISANIIGFLEAFLDSGDAVRRRRAADRIYKALIGEQVSSHRAALELKKLTSRQKGGWLGAQIGAMGATLAGLVPGRRSRG